MIDALVDSTLAAYLSASLAASGYGSFTVVTGIQDNLPDLACPYLVVHSGVERFYGRDHVFELRTRIELHSLSGIEPVSDLKNLMSALDASLLAYQQSNISTPGLLFLGWDGIQRSEQLPGDRRLNSREIAVFAQLASSGPTPLDILLLSPQNISHTLTGQQTIEAIGNASAPVATLYSSNTKVVFNGITETTTFINTYTVSFKINMTTVTAPGEFPVYLSDSGNQGNTVYLNVI